MGTAQALEHVHSSKALNAAALIPHLICQALLSVQADRYRWLEGAREQSSGLGRLAEAVVHFELSREGRLWLPSTPAGSGSHAQPAADYGALLRQLGEAAGALYAAQRQVGLS